MFFNDLKSGEASERQANQVFYSVLGVKVQYSVLNSSLLN